MRGTETFLLNFRAGDVYNIHCAVKGQRLLCFPPIINTCALHEIIQRWLWKQWAGYLACCSSTIITTERVIACRGVDTSWCRANTLKNRDPVQSDTPTTLTTICTTLSPPRDRPIIQLLKKLSEMFKQIRDVLTWAWSAFGARWIQSKPSHYIFSIIINIIDKTALSEL
jgi:hypothetical protein